MAGRKRIKGSGRRAALVAGAVLGMVLGSGCSDGAASSGGSSAERAASDASSDANSDGKELSSMALASPSPSPVESMVESVVEERSPEQLVEAGRSVYNANCIACHGVDPTRDGALGPAVAGSSLELLEARVVRGEYPPGYQPKRPSRVMIALPHLESKLPELAAYLQSL